MDSIISILYLAKEAWGKRQIEKWHAERRIRETKLRQLEQFYRGIKK